MGVVAARISGILLLTLATAAVAAAATLEPESKRLARAKDFIADEQWSRAVDELRAAVADDKETRKDEALYWLAHSLNQSADAVAALSIIGSLEKSYPKSLWVRPARTLRLDIAMRLGRRDVLWMTAAPPAPPAVPAGTATAPPTPPRPATPAAVPPPPPPKAQGAAPPAAPVQPPPPAPPAPLPPKEARMWVAGSPGTIFWLPDGFQPDSELRIQALGYLMRTDADKAIPMLKEIALEAKSPGPASRAVFVLAQSDRPEARETVVQVASSGPVSVRVAAVRELGRFGGPDVGQVLLTVYTSAGDEQVKRQVVRSLGERAQRRALLRIAETEANVDLQTRAIVTLGQAGGAPELKTLYTKVKPGTKRPIIAGLFNAKADTELIEIAQVERDRTLQQEILTHLRLLDTPRTREFLQKVSDRR